MINLERKNRMIFSYVLAFLYFPEDKTEYIPAVINLIIFTIFAYLAVRFFIKISKREEKKAKQLEEDLKIITQEKDS
jgi:hypothetical protein